MGGRPRKPTAVKKLQGTLQKCRTNTLEPIPQVDLKQFTEPPEYLTESAKDIWTFALQQAPEGMLSSLDYSIFSEWVILYDQFIKLSEGLKQQGTFVRDADGNQTVNNIINSITKTATILRGIENELGFTPASRSKVSSFKTSSEKKNKFEGF